MQGQKTGDKEPRRKTKIIHLDAVSQMYAWLPSKELVKRIETMKVALKKAMKQEAVKNPMRKAQGNARKVATKQQAMKKAMKMATKKVAMM